MDNRKTVLITGTSTGLGRATALYFAAQGWNVAATMRNPQKADAMSDIANIRIIELDVTQPDTIRKAIDQTIEFFGAIDVVVNNAGMGVYGALELVSEQDIDQQYAVNVRGVINVIRAVLPHFRSMKSGKFINIGSVMGMSTALPLGSLYNMSKFALEGLTEGLYFELKPLNVSLHLVEPGGFSSNFGENVVFQKSDVITDYVNITKNVSDVMAAAGLKGATPPPDAIVETIYQLATGKKKSFRNVVGKDAKTVLFLRKLMPVKAFLNLLTRKFTGQKA
jgi:NAD(P)-dependent dehydrogenase (short-subunit alcohol dehydrogenase family)